MSKIKFKRTVLQATSLLTQHGYQMEEPSPDSHLIRFWKKITTGVLCIIDFQLLENFTPPNRQFNVWLFRRRLDDFPSTELHYLPLMIDLPNLLRFFYKLDVLPIGKYWQFTDEQTLAEQLAKAQSLLIDYGLPWQEGPTSDTEWVRHPESRP